MVMSKRQTSEGDLLSRLFEASYDPGLTDVDRNELERKVKMRVNELTHGIDRALAGHELVEELDERVYGYVGYDDDSDFAIDFALNQKGNCAVYADLIVTALEYLDRKDVLKNVRVKYVPGHVWLIYRDGSLPFEINPNVYGSEKDHPLESLIAANFSNKGVDLDDLGKHNEAIECCDEAIGLDPTYANAWNNKAVALGHLHRHNEAIECCDEAIRLNPDYVNPWCNKAVALYMLSNYSKAKEYIDRALELKPDHFPSLNARDFILRKLGEL